MSEALDIDTPATVNADDPFAGTVLLVVVVEYVTPVVTQPLACAASGTAAPSAFTDVMVTGNGFGLFTESERFAPEMPG